MRRTFLVGLGLLALVVLIGLVAGWLALPRTYEGKTLRQHLAEHKQGSLSFYQQAETMAEHPLMQLLRAHPPEHIIPDLTALLSQPPEEPGALTAWVDPTRDQIFALWYQVTGIQLIESEDPTITKRIAENALLALGHLGPTAEAAKPSLWRIALNPEMGEANRALDVLGKIGIDNEELLAQTLPILTGPNAAGDVRCIGILNLWRQHGLLIEQLSYWEPLARNPAARAHKTAAHYLINAKEIPEDRVADILAESVFHAAPGEAYSDVLKWFFQHPGHANPKLISYLQATAEATPEGEDFSGSKILMREAPDSVQWKECPLRMMNRDRNYISSRWHDKIAGTVITWRARHKLAELNPGKYPLEDAHRRKMQSAVALEAYSAAVDFLQTHPDRIDEGVAGLLHATQDPGDWEGKHVALEALKRIGEQGAPAASAIPRLKQLREQWKLERKYWQLVDGATIAIALLEGREPPPPAKGPPPVRKKKQAKTEQPAAEKSR